MKAQLYWLNLVLLCFTLQAFAQDEAETTTTETTAAVEESATTMEESRTPAEAADETPAVTAEEPEPEPVKKEEKWITCANSYIQYVRGLPAAKRNAEFEKWWELQDGKFKFIKQDEFQWKEQHPIKLKEFQAAVAAQPETESILLKIKLGAYDFKKKGFPVSFATNPKDRSLQSQESYASGGYRFGGFGSRAPEEKIDDCNTSLSSDRRKKMPFSGRLRPTNLAKLKFIAVPEEQAKALTPLLGTDRVVTAVVRFIPGKAEIKEAFWADVHILYVDVTLKELEFTAGEGRVSATF